MTSDFSKLVVKHRLHSI